MNERAHVVSAYPSGWCRARSPPRVRCFGHVRGDARNGGARGRDRRPPRDHRRVLGDVPPRPRLRSRDGHLRRAPAVRRTLRAHPELRSSRRERAMRRATAGRRGRRRGDPTVLIGGAEDESERRRARTLCWKAWKQPNPRGLHPVVDGECEDAQLVLRSSGVFSSPAHSAPMRLPSTSWKSTSGLGEETTLRPGGGCARARRRSSSRGATCARGGPSPT